MIILTNIEEINVKMKALLNSLIQVLLLSNQFFAIYQESTVSTDDNGNVLEKSFQVISDAIYVAFSVDMAQYHLNYITKRL